MLREQKITFGEMREFGVVVFCADYRCSHSIALPADRWPDILRLSDRACLRLPGMWQARCGRAAAFGPYPQGQQWCRPEGLTLLEAECICDPTAECHVRRDPKDDPLDRFPRLCLP